MGLSRIKSLTMALSVLRFPIVKISFLIPAGQILAGLSFLIEVSVPVVPDTESRGSAHSPALLGLASQAS